jgi:hypothetical protein
MINIASNKEIEDRKKRKENKKRLQNYTKTLIMTSSVCQGEFNNAKKGH